MKNSKTKKSLAAVEHCRARLRQNRPFRICRPFTQESFHIRIENLALNTRDRQYWISIRTVEWYLIFVKYEVRQ